MFIQYIANRNKLVCVHVFDIYLTNIENVSTIQSMRNLRGYRSSNSKIIVTKLSILISYQTDVTKLSLLFNYQLSLPNC